VERLRWVLRQQREHFLPLKVIRDRLSEGDLDEGADLAELEFKGEGAPKVANGSVPQHAAVGVGAAPVGSRPGVGSGAGSGSGGAGRHLVSSGGLASTSAGPARSEEELRKADSEAMARILADASRRAALMPESAKGAVVSLPADAPGSLGSSSDGGGLSAPLSAPAVTTGSALRPTGSVPAVSPTASAAPTVTGAKVATGPSPALSPAPTERGSGAARSASGSAAPHMAAAATEPAPASGTAATKAAKPSEGSKDDGGAAAAAAGAGNTGASAGRASSGAARGNRPLITTTSMVTGASLTAEELCSAAGLSEVELASLEGFGLIDSMQVAGLATYNEDALTVANLAAELRVFGIEPRHLRLYKNAVDREVGLIEQVIIPLLRQRNPESRQRAIDSAEQLGTLGQTMRATLLRAALRQHLGG
jgi:hypothetical protein